MKRAWSVVWLTVVGCSGDASSDEDERDQGASTRDSGPLDAGALDTGTFDTGTFDAGTSARDARAAEDAASACTMGTPKLDVTAVSVRGTPKKGDAIELELQLSNSGGGALVTITPELDSQRLSDYEGVPLASSKALVCPGTTRVVVTGGPFLSKGAKQYALGSGRYTVSAVQLDDTRDEQFEGAGFELAKSNALLVPVVFDQRYLDGIDDNTFETPEAFLEASFTRPNEIFTPNGNDPDGAGSYQSYAEGFDEMMKVKHHFKAFPGFPGEKTTSDGWCEDATAYGAKVLGLAAAWKGQPAQTRPERHGFDYLLALTPDLGGGVACGWLDVQVSGFINRDIDRQQVIAVHETGHIFGAPHCDDVGNGSGGSLQGYVMCSGEKHEHYPEQFVWHATSIEQMKSHWD
jgi:hypothetical protein